MATGGGKGEVTLLATYCGKRLSLTVPTNAKVGDVVQKAVETLNLRKEDLPLSLLYQGNPIDDQAPLDVSQERSDRLARAWGGRVSRQRPPAGGSGQDEGSDGHSPCQEEPRWKSHHAESSVNY